jgi:hypothetical protein
LWELPIVSYRSRAKDGGLLREQAAAAVEEVLAAVEFDERAVDGEDAFIAVLFKVTRLVVLVEDTLGASRVDAMVLVKHWEELDITLTDEGVQEEEDIVV